MATSTPYAVVTASAVAGTNPLVTGTITNNVPAGDLCVVFVGNSGGNTVSSFIDSKGNSWNPGVTAGSGNQRVALYSSLITNALVSGVDTFTATYSGTAGAKFIIARGATGMSTANADKTSTGAATSNAPSSGATATLSQASEVVFGAIQNAAATISAPSFGSLLTVTSTSALSEIEEVVTANTAQTASATLSGSVVWSALIASFEISLPMILTLSLPGVTSGSAYSQTLNESGGLPTYTWSITSGSLTGSGLSLSSGGVISGTAASVGTYSFTVQVSDGNGNTASQALSIVVSSAFPSQILDLEADMLIGGAWTSITSNVYSERAKPTITRGRPDGSQQANPSTAAFQLNNQSDNFNPYNPLGTYYGQINRNTPIRFHVPEPVNYGRFEDDNASSWVTGNLSFPGNITAVVDMNLNNWTATCLVSQCGVVTNLSWGFLLNADGTLSWMRSTDGINPTIFTSSQPLPFSMIGSRFTVKALYTSGTASVTFSYATSISGPFTQLGNVITNASGVVFATTADLTIGYNSYFGTLGGINGGYAAGPGVSFAPSAYQGPNGKIYEVQVKAGGTIVADAIFSGQNNGTTSFTDAKSNTWTANGTTTVSSRKFRFHGEMADWPQRWDSTGKDVYVDVTANGQLRRAQVGNNPLQSAMTRAWLNDFTGVYAPVAYWPCEDGTGSTQIASGLNSSTPFVSTPMTINTTKDKNNPTSFASNSNFLCTNPIPVPNKDSWVGSLPFYKLPATPDIVVTFLLSIPSGGDTNNISQVLLTTGGDVNFAYLNYDTGSGGELQFVGQDANGNNLFSSTKITGVNGDNMLVQLSLQTSATSTVYQMSVLDLTQNSATTVTNSLSSTATRHLRQVYINPNNSQMSSAIGQISVQTTYGPIDVLDFPTNLIGPFNAWAGETAGLRFARLCNEQGFNYRVVGYPAKSVPMGAQTAQTFMQLLQECEDADHGMIFEPRTGLGLGYICNSGLTNQTASVAFSYTSAQLGGGGGMQMQPTLDDLLTANDQIITRSNAGSSVEIMAVDASYSATAALCSLSVPNGVGIYQNTATINVWDDFQLYDQAGWLVHMGTVNEYRYPAIPVDLSRSAVTSLYNSIQDIDLGDYIQITSPPAWLTYDTIKAIVWGTTEQLGGYIFTEQFNTQPESPYETLVAGTGATSDNRADTAGSTLHTTVSSSATSLSISTTGSILWTTTAGDFPFDIMLDGERMTVTNITGTSSPQTFTVTRSVDGVVKGHNSGVAVNIFNPVYAALV